MSPKVFLVSTSNMSNMLWKNGGGSTTEIWISPSGINVSMAFHWRLSSAKVTSSGDFSLFPSCERHLIQLEGEPFFLHHRQSHEVAIIEKLKKQLVLGEPYRFDGAWETGCTMEGSGALDFNLIVRKDFGKGFLQSVKQVDATKEEPFVVASNSKIFFVWLFQGALEIKRDENHWNLLSGDLLLAESSEDSECKFQIAGHGKLVVGGIYS